MFFWKKKSQNIKSIRIKPKFLVFILWILEGTKKSKMRWYQLWFTRVIKTVLNLAIWQQWIIMEENKIGGQEDVCSKAQMCREYDGSFHEFSHISHSPGIWQKKVKFKKYYIIYKSWICKVFSTWIQISNERKIRENYQISLSSPAWSLSLQPELTTRN